VTQDGGHSYLPLLIDEGVPDGCIWVAAGIPASLTLGNIFGPVELEKV
jgi:NADH-quinone oxidoreductase subunit G